MIRINLQDVYGNRIKPMPRWASWLAMAGSMALGLTLFLVAASLALILIPVVLIGGGIAAWQLKRRLREAGLRQGQAFGRDSGAESEIIDVEYRIIDQDQRRP